jgi:hypothetical protein
MRGKYKFRNFLGVYTYYKMFIPGFAGTAKPLKELKEYKRTFRRSPEAEAAFRSLKESSCVAPVLEYPRPREKFILDTDASKVGTGSVLSQVELCKERLVDYYTRTLSKAQEILLDLMAVTGCYEEVEHFHTYQYGQEFYLHTDHSTLTWIRNTEGQTWRGDANNVTSAQQAERPNSEQGTIRENRHQHHRTHPPHQEENRYLVTDKDYFNKWSDIYAIPDQETSIVVAALVTNFFRRFEILRELHNDQGRNLE